MNGSSRTDRTNRHTDSQTYLLKRQIFHGFLPVVIAYHGVEAVKDGLVRFGVDRHAASDGLEENVQTGPVYGVGGRLVIYIAG